MRVAIAGFHHETNTFSSIPADLAAFGVHRGEEIVAQYSGSNHTIAGFLRTCDEQRALVVPLVHADLWPCGTISAEAFERLSDEIVRVLSDRGPFDVVLLAMHGAAVSEHQLDVDAELAARVRAMVGTGVTIGVVLDLHGNVNERLVESVDVIVGYRENPHRDPAVRGAECAALALSRARGQVCPVQRLVRLPMVVPILGGWTAQGAMRDVMSVAARIADEERLLSYTVFHGFGYADVPHMGSSILAVADRDTEAADRAAQAIAASLWERRDHLQSTALAPVDAVVEADRRARGNGPVVVLDVGDNVGGGSPGDSTVLLAAALEHRIRGFVATVCDQHGVQAGMTAGAGAGVTVALGRTTAVSAGPRVEVTACVTRITDGRFEDPNPTHGGFRYYDAGPTVRLTTADDQEIVVSSLAVPALTPEQLRAVGVEPREQRVIVAKGVVSPRAGYEPVASQFLIADTPGVTTADLSQLSYRRRSSPLWPLDVGEG